MQDRLFESNPQAKATATARREYDGHPDLGTMWEGYQWLASLYQEKTSEANALTLEWLKEVNPC